MKRKLIFGLLVFVISALSLLQIGCSNKKTSDKSSSNTEVNNESSQSSYDCPHCNGSGQRQNGVTGEYGKCNTCSGTGKLTKEQYDRTSK